MIFAKSVNATKFIEYLKLVREANGDRKLALFMDNLNVHRTKKVKEEMEKLEIKPLYNVVY